MQETELCKSLLEVFADLPDYHEDRAVTTKFHISLSISYFYLFCSIGKWQNMFRKINVNLYFKLLLPQKVCIISQKIIYSFTHTFVCFVSA